MSMETQRTHTIRDISLTLESSIRLYNNGRGPINPSRRINRLSPGVYLQEVITGVIHQIKKEDTNWVPAFVGARSLGYGYSNEQVVRVLEKLRDRVHRNPNFDKIPLTDQIIKYASNSYLSVISAVDPEQNF